MFQLKSSKKNESIMGKNCIFMIKDYFGVLKSLFC